MRKLIMVLIIAFTLIGGSIAEDYRTEIFSKKYANYTVKFTVGYDKDTAGYHRPILKASALSGDVYVTDKESAIGEWLEDYANYLCLNVTKEYSYTDGRKRAERIETETIWRMSNDIYVVQITSNYKNE